MKYFEMRQDCEPIDNEFVIELEKGPDALGRYSFTMYWIDASRGLRAQCFFADPRDYIKRHEGHHRIVDRTNTWKGDK